MLYVCVGDVVDVCSFCWNCEAWSCRCSCMGTVSSCLVGVSCLPHPASECFYYL